MTKHSPLIRMRRRTNSPTHLRNMSICAQHAAGSTYAELARRHGLSPNRVKDIVSTMAKLDRELSHFVSASALRPEDV